VKTHLQILSIVLLATAIFTNCKNSPAPGTEGSFVDTLAVNESYVEGYWVNKAWWETLQSTKSPLQASSRLGVAAIVVQKDSTGAWEAAVNYAFHEGMIYKLRPAEDGNFTLLYNEGEPKAHDFKLNADKTVFLDSFEMVRIGDGMMDDTDLSAGIVDGSYSLKGKPVEVTFWSNGSVSGLDGYDRYEFLFDYVVDEVGADQMMLIKTNSDMERDFYVFEVKGNQLLLYTIDEKLDKDNNTVYEKGKVMFELTKK
jgi:hypothetical protein